MNRIKQGSKEHVLQILEKAKKATDEEQDQYRAIVENSLGPRGQMDIDKQYIKGGWGMVMKAMADCKHPPSPGDREQYLKVSWNETLTHLELEKIKDSQIRFFTSHLNSLIEHTQRLRSMAMFAERIGSLQGRGGVLYSIWAENSGLHIMLEEAAQMGKIKESEVIRIYIYVNNCFAEFVLEPDWDREATRKKAIAEIEKLNLENI